MLDMALEREDDRILYLMQDMREFEPGEKVSAVVSACDSINYILEPEDLQAVFFCVSESLKEGGILYLISILHTNMRCSWLIIP